MKLKNKLIIGAAALAGLAFSLGSPAVITSAHGGISSCSDEVTFVEPERLDTVFGVEVIEISTGAPAAGIQLELSQQVMGNAQPTADNTLWRMEWDTRYAMTGTYILAAEVMYENDTTCEVQGAISVEVDNPNSLDVSGAIDPNPWQGRVDESTQFEVDVFPSDQAEALVDVAKYADVVWLTNQVGTFADPTDVDSIFQAGAEPIQGEVVAFVSYGGSTAAVRAAVELSIPPSYPVKAIALVVGPFVVVGVLIKFALPKLQPKKRR